MGVYPWNEEAEHIFRRISTFGRARTDNVKLAREFSKKTEIRQLCRQDLFSISHNRRKHESWFTIPENVFVRPKNTKRGICFEFEIMKY